MYSIRTVTDDLFFIGANDNRLSLFENIHPIPEGVSYNSYLLLDEKTVVFDLVDWAVGRQFLDNLEYQLNDRTLDFIVINHVEPDHVSTLEILLKIYPSATIISNEKAFGLLDRFGYSKGYRDVVGEGDVRSFGKHEVTFVMAPMVHWPEAMVTFDTTNGVLFSADAFGAFKSLNGSLFEDEVNFKRIWIDEARRYYTNIVGKYGKPVQALLKKASGLDIKMIAPLHGPLWRSNIDYIVEKYQRWSTYTPEKDGVVIVYGSMYGNTESVAQSLASKLYERGVKNVIVKDVSKTHVSYLINDVFKYSHLVLASVTYNLEIYPPMEAFLNDMKMLNVQNRKLCIIENGTWAIKAGDKIRQFTQENMVNMEVMNDNVTIESHCADCRDAEIDALANSITRSLALNPVK